MIDQLRRWIAGRRRGGRPSWIPASEKNRLLVFLHLPKAAGTSMNSVLARVYGRGFLDVAHRTAEVVEDGVTDPADVFAVSGHFPYAWPDSLRVAGGEGLAFEGRDLTYVSLVRDPVERVISYYRFVTGSKTHRHYSACATMDPGSFFRYLDDIGDGECWDQQSRMMSGRANADVDLDKYFLVAPMERANDFVACLGEALAWPHACRLPHRNRSTQSVDRSALFGDELLEMIRERSRRDLLLYEQVVARFDRCDFPAFEDSSR